MPAAVDLKALPPDHELRNRPLSEIGAEYRPATRSYGWQRVGQHFGIARSCFNDLGPAWVDDTEWRVREDGDA